MKQVNNHKSVIKDGDLNHVAGNQRKVNDLVQIEIAVFD
jgi:hypothetical protein